MHGILQVKNSGMNCHALPPADLRIYINAGEVTHRYYVVHDRQH